MPAFTKIDGRANNKLPVGKKNITCIKNGDIREIITVEIDRNSGKTAVVIGLNPSTADSEKSDNTLTRTARYLWQYGMGRVTMINLYETVSISPDGIHSKHLCDLNRHQSLFEKADMIVIAWGVGNEYKEAKVKAEALLLQYKEKVYCIERKSGNRPAHPSRISYGDKLVYYYVG